MLVITISLVDPAISGSIHSVILNKEIQLFNIHVHNVIIINSIIYGNCPLITKEKTTAINGSE